MCHGFHNPTWCQGAEFGLHWFHPLHISLLEPGPVHTHLNCGTTGRKKQSRSLVSQVKHTYQFRISDNRVIISTKTISPYLSQLMLSGSLLWVRLLVSWLMGKSPPSITSPGKLKRLVEILWNHSGVLALQLRLNAQNKTSRVAGAAMMQISWRWRLK